MSISKNIRNWTDLIAVFQGLKSRYTSADIQLRNGIDYLCHQLQQERIIHSSINKRGKTWGAKSLVQCFCEKFDPMLVKLFPVNSISHQYLKNQQVFLPLINQMQHKENSKMVAFAIDQAIRNLESLISINSISKNNVPESQWTKIQSDTENLQLVARLISAIYTQLGCAHSLKWCDICFRMANNASSYCSLHSSRLDDTAYRKALKIKKTIPTELQKQFEIQRSNRIIFGNKFTMASNEKDVPETITPEMLLIFVDEDVINLVSDTKKLKWHDVALYWDLTLNVMPYVRNRFQRNAVDFKSWPEFARYTQVALDNYNDTTIHPYWIRTTLAEAEVWLTFEDGLSLQKAEPKKNKILALLRNGLRNRDIVNQLQVTNSYVSELRKKNNKNRTNN